MDLYRFVLPVLLWEAGQMWSVTKHAGDTLHHNYKTKVFEATQTCDAAKDLFTLPSLQVKLPQPQFSWDRLPSAAFRCGLREQSGHHPSVFLPNEAVSRRTSLHCKCCCGQRLSSYSSPCIYCRWSPWETVFALCAFPVAFLPDTVLRSRIWEQMYHRRYSGESDKSFGFSHLTWKPPLLVFCHLTSGLINTT